MAHSGLRSGRKLPSPCLRNGLRNRPEYDKLWKPAVATVDTGAVKVLISLDWGNLEFQDEQGHRLLQELPGRAAPISENHRQWRRALQRERSVLPGCAGRSCTVLVGVRNGVFNYRRTTLELGQANTDITIPLMISTNGYGIFWNTAALSWFDNRFPSKVRFSSNASHAIDYYFLYETRVRPDHPSVPRYDRPRAHVRRVGLWLLAVEGPLQERR